MIKKRTTKSGAVRYDVRLRDPNGNTRNRTFRTKADAERYERDELTALDRGGWIDPTQRKRRFDD